MERFGANQTDKPPPAIGDMVLQKKGLDKLSNWRTVYLNIWYKKCRDQTFEKSTKILHWVAYDCDFEPAKLDSRFKQWINRGITS